MHSWQTFLCINIFFFHMKATLSSPVLSEMSVRLQILGMFFKWAIFYSLNINLYTRDLLRKIFMFLWGFLTMQVSINIV